MIACLWLSLPSLVDLDVINHWRYFKYFFCECSGLICRNKNLIFVYSNLCHVLYCFWLWFDTEPSFLLVPSFYFFNIKSLVCLLYVWHCLLVSVLTKFSFLLLLSFDCFLGEGSFFLFCFVLFFFGCVGSSSLRMGFL